MLNDFRMNYIYILYGCEFAARKRSSFSKLAERLGRRELLKDMLVLFMRSPAESHGMES